MMSPSLTKFLQRSTSSLQCQSSTWTFGTAAHKCALTLCRWVIALAGWQARVTPMKRGRHRWLTARAHRIDGGTVDNGTTTRLETTLCIGDVSQIVEVAPSATDRDSSR